MVASTPGHRPPGLRHRRAGPGDGHPQPDARLLLRPGRHVRARHLLRRADDLVAAGCRPARRGRREGRARPGGRARRRSWTGSSRRSARSGRPLRRTPLGRHLAGVGGQGAFAAGAVVGNDISGFADPDYLPAAPRRCHRRGHPHPPRTAGPRPRAVLRRRRRLGDVVPCRAGGRAEAAGIPSDRIVLDAGLDLGKTAEQSLDPAARLGPPGRPRLPAAPLGVEQDVPRGDARSRGRSSGARLRWPPAALGVALGCRIVRVHDVAAHRQVL